MTLSPYESIEIYQNLSTNLSVANHMLHNAYQNIVHETSKQNLTCMWKYVKRNMWDEVPEVSFTPTK